MSRAEELRREIEEKQKELEEIESEWPKRVTSYLHGSKEDAYYKCETELGIDDPEFARNYMSALYEVEFELEVERDGTTRIVKVNGRELEPDPNES